MSIKKQTIFTKDLESRNLNVVREFAAPIADVWKAWTDSKILDLWWAPKPWKAETKSMDFREGGCWIYSMNGPEGEKHWARADYSKITPQKNFSAKDAFCDDKGVINTNFPRMNWNTNFIEINGGTKVDIKITFDSAKDLETIIEMGFKEGFSAAHENLDALLSK